MSNNKQQTAVEYFAKEIFYTIELLKKGYVNDQDLLNTIIVISDKAKEMEKKQCVDFALKCMLNGLEPHQSTREVVERLFDESLQ